MPNKTRILILEDSPADVELESRVEKSEAEVHSVRVIDKKKSL